MKTPWLKVLRLPLICRIAGSEAERLGVDLIERPQYQGRMIKAITTDESGRKILMLGLSFGNLAKFKAEPLDTFIKIDGTEMGLPFDVLLFSGETEGEIGRFFANRIGPETKVYIDPRLRT